MPGATFSLDQQRRLKDWADGPGEKRPRSASRQARRRSGCCLNSGRPSMSNSPARVGFATKGMTASDFVDRLSRQLRMNVSIDAAARAELAAGEKVHDELAELSAGTGLAAAFVPGGTDRSAASRGRSRRARCPRRCAAKGAMADRLAAATSAGAIDSGICGTGERRNRRNAAVPTCFQRSKTRLKAPLLFDHNAGPARHRVDPARSPSGIRGRADGLWTGCAKDPRTGLEIRSPRR